jgi:tRNA U34 5-carboxymethylaminomethyl modifying GTPase MnmE/TrmE
LIIPFLYTKTSQVLSQDTRPNIVVILCDDFSAQDIRQALHYLGEIIGEIATDDLHSNIFNKFCIGK